LSFAPAGVSLRVVNETWKKLLPLVFMLLFALSRIPGVLPFNFSAAYAIAFCGGVYFSGAMAWWLPLGTLAVTDILLNVFYYQQPVFSSYMLVKTLGFVGIVALGRLFSPNAKSWKLLGGSLLGAIMFYLITNSASWLFDPGYAKTLLGWIQSLTTGLPGLPPTWMFLLKTLLSSALFTSLFVGAMKLTVSESPVEKEAGRRPEETEKESEPEEAKA
jgi:hypothetical protein